MSDCLSRETMERILAGGTAAAATEHLRSCQACRATLDRLSDDSVLQQWRQLRRAAPPTRAYASH